jgi:hypothetical protein
MQKAPPAKAQLELREIEGLKGNFKLTEDLIALARKDGEAKAALSEALNSQGRQ